MKKLSIGFSLALLIALLLFTTAYAINPGYTYDSAPSISLNQTYTGNYDNFYDKSKRSNYYAFTLPESSEVIFQCTITNVESTENKPQILIYDESGKDISGSGNFYIGYDKSTRKGTATFHFWLNKGTYRIAFIEHESLYAYLYYHYCRYSYSFSLSANPTGETFVETLSSNNNTVQTASRYSLGTNCVGQIGWQDDANDYYSFTIADNDVLDLKFNFYFSKVKLILYDSQGNTVWSATPDWNSFTKVGERKEEIFHLAGGTYFFDVQRVDYNYGKYDFVLSKGAPHQHDYVQTQTPVTLTQDGKIIYTCRCGDTYETVIFSRPSNISFGASGFAYKGKNIKPSVNVTAADGSVISADNYTVEYPSNCKNIGVYNATISFRGNYSNCGKVVGSYCITPAKAKMSSASGSSRAVTAKWKKLSGGVSGYQIQLSTSKTFIGSVKTVRAKASATRLKVKKLNARTKYYVRVRGYKSVPGGILYGEWSSKKSTRTR